MRNGGIWHPRLIEVIASLGHTDTLVVSDAGLPVPSGVECIDLVWARGEPALMPVLGAVLVELRVESAMIAKELNGSMLGEIGRALGELPVDRVSHEDLKGAVATARAVVRTGETTPYANVVLRAGVVF
ncbi:MAG TPA: D-ribose pyranase [Nakamurella sp.]|jgi:D-ribose pyranase|nr:D-ribose pyranase [Nakamurella sp.]